MRVQVHLRAEKLGNIARGRWWGKKSNPYAKVSLTGESATLASSSVDLGATEIIDGNLNPKWTTIFILDHDESKNWTPLNITIHDSPTSNSAKRRDSHGAIQPNTVLPRKSPTSNHTSATREDPKMGTVEVEVGEILGMIGQEKECPLIEGGSLFVHITKSQEVTDPTIGTFSLHIRGLDLKNIESGFLGLGAIDPYFELSKKYVYSDNGIQKWNVIYRSEDIANSINPYWDPLEIDLERLCNGDLEKPLRIEVWDRENWGENRLLAGVDVSVSELQESVTRGGNANRENALSVENKSGEGMGLLVVLEARISL